ncbi:MAG TPA: alpha/beta hydrolase [Chitinophagales bacterium]|nr:alpha/beta hydrolase [Chitinophagales bacterium]
MSTTIFHLDNHQYIDKGEGEVLVMLHGLFSNLANFQHTVDYFSKNHRTIVPFFPLAELSVDEANVDGLVQYLESLLNILNIEKCTIVGNSLGGHVGIEYTLKHLHRVNALVLTGSSGLFEKNSTTQEIPKRGNYEYIQQKTQKTFYNPLLATKEIVDEVFEIVNDRAKATKVLKIAKSAVRNNLSQELARLSIPVFLIWGENDEITPPSVAEEFHKLIPNSKLAWINNCGHSAMMERPNRFNELLDEFLRSLKQKN